MSDLHPKYQVIIHGDVVGLAIGDQASAQSMSQDSLAATDLRRPFMTPLLPVHGVVGRDDELTHIHDALRLGESDLLDVAPVALRGLGGIGKTTLAIALARLVFIPDLFPDGVLWAALGPKPTVRLALESWGRALGVDLLPERDETACSARLRAILNHRSMLLIVDDVWETVHGTHFLIGGPRCRTLFTTRELPVAQDLATRERTIRVDVLKPPAALALLTRIAPDLMGDSSAAVRLCERLEFLPLAITLAGRLLANEADVPSRASRLLGELIEKREARLQLLQSEGRLGLDEESPVSLHAILGMSVERLGKTDQERFAMLGVFGGEPLTWDIAAAAAVWECTEEEAEKTISHFIQRGLTENRGGRYWTHALLADYAEEMMNRLGL